VQDENGQNRNFFYNDLYKYLVSDVQPNTFKHSLRLLSLLYDELAYDELFYNLEELNYSWNGEELSSEKIYKNFQQGVIDINDLISFQWFGIKWLIGKILLDIKNALLLLCNKLKIEVADEISSIKSRLNRLLELALPMTLHIFVKDLIEATIKTLDYNSIFFGPDIRYEWTDLYGNNLKALGIKHASQHRSFSMDQITVVLDFDIKRLEFYLNKPFLGTQNLFISTELSLLSVGRLISDKSLQILYNY